MAIDTLETLGAKASTGMVLILKTLNILFIASEDLIF